MCEWKLACTLFDEFVAHIFVAAASQPWQRLHFHSCSYFFFILCDEGPNYSQQLVDVILCWPGQEILCLFTSRFAARMQPSNCWMLLLTLVWAKSCFTCDAIIVRLVLFFVVVAFFGPLLLQVVAAFLWLIYAITSTNNLSTTARVRAHCIRRSCSTMTDFCVASSWRQNIPQKYSGLCSRILHTVCYVRRRSARIWVHSITVQVVAAVSGCCGMCRRSYLYLCKSI